MNYQQLCDQVNELSRSVGERIQLERKSFNPNDIEIKGLHDYVTHIDKLSEELLVKGLSEILPEAGLIAEVRKREHYEKPTTIRKRAAAAAVKRHAKKVLRENRKRQRLY